MAQFTVNPDRFDPYRNFKFQVRWDNRIVAGVSKVSALKRSSKVVEFREGGDPSTSRKLPGRTEYEAITLEAGSNSRPFLRAMGEQGVEFRGWIGQGIIAGRFPKGRDRQLPE
jgi:phage tail-like protein